MKSTVRNNILKILSLLSRDEKKHQSELIQNHLQNLLSHESGSWVAYKNLKDEPEIQWNKVSEQISWFFPKIQKDRLEFYQAADPSADGFSRSTLGFLEPLKGTQININDIRGFVIPGLAYDRLGYRLGRGKGYYDRALAGYKGKKIGVCFESSFCEELPSEDHDIKCDQIVTASQIYAVGKSEGVRKWN